MRYLEILMGVVLVVTIGMAVLAATVLVASGQSGSPAVQAPAVLAPAELELTAPANGGMLGGTTLTVRFSAAHFQLTSPMIVLAETTRRPEVNRPGQGHVHLMLDLQPLVSWARSEPYTFNNVPPGDHQLTVELVNNDHSSLSPPVMRVVHFKTTGPTTLAKSGQPAELEGSLGLLALAGLLLVAGWLVRCRGARAERLA